MSPQDRVEAVERQAAFEETSEIFGRVGHMAVIVVVCIACVEQHVHLRLMLCCISGVGGRGTWLWVVWEIGLVQEVDLQRSACRFCRTGEKRRSFSDNEAAGQEM